MKQLSITFLLTVLMSMVGAKASAHDIEVENADGVTIYYNWNSDKTELSVTYRGSSPEYYWNRYSGNVVIPSSVTYDGKEYSVTSIGSNAFDGCTGLTSVEIPSSVTRIGYRAFNRCSGLTSVTIPNSVTSIGSGAFFDCSGLTSVTIPDSVASIGGDAFGNTAWLKNQPYGVVHAGKVIYTYKGTMPSDSHIKLTEGVVGIADYAFVNCSGLTSIRIPNSVTNIGGHAFDGCSGLTNILVASDNTKYDSRDNCNAIIETASNKLIAGGQNTIIPNSVTSIGSRAFYGRSGMTSITIPNSITSIGDCAFNRCSGLTSVTIPNSVTSIGEGAFEYCTSLTSITIPNNVTTIDRYALSGCSSLTFVKIPNSVKIIDYEAFSRCSSLTSVTIPNSVTSIGKSAFYDCSSLTSVTIPNSVTTIGESAFASCSGLTSVTIPNSVTSIGEGAFSICSGLTTVTIGNSVETIGNYAFYNCTAVTKLYCSAPTPPTCGTQALNDINKWNCTLTVPAGHIADYEAADQWKDFFFIEEGTSGIRPQHISNAKDGKLYDLNGKHTASPRQGINIIKRNDGTAKKVVVK